MVAEMRRRLAAHPGLQPEHHQPQPARRRRIRRLPDLSGAARARPRCAGDLLAARHRTGAEAPEPRRPQDLAEHRQPGDSRHARSAAGGRPRRPDEDRRRRAAAHGRRRRRDLDASARARSSTRSRCACWRASGATSKRSASSRSPRRKRRARPHRQHRAARSRPRPEHAAALQPPVLGQPQRRRRARPRAGRGLRRRPTGPHRPPAAAWVLVPPERADQDSRRDDRATS